MTLDGRRRGGYRGLYDDQQAVWDTLHRRDQRLVTPVSQHREGATPGFTKTHGLKRLVWFERHDDMLWAIHREKLLKRYPREWKINLIERDNPHWDDLFEGLL